MQGYEGNSTLEVRSDAEIRAELTALRDAGQLGADVDTRFPHAAATLLAMGVAERLRQAAASLDKIASNAPLYEASTLRRLVSGIVRATVSEIEGQVSL